MSVALSLQAVEQLHRTPVSDLKKFGWRSVMRAVGREGRVLVTNHDQPEAVILSTDAYQALLEAAQSGQQRQADALDALRERFDARLAALAQPQAADRLSAMLRQPAALHGQVRAGEGH